MPGPVLPPSGTTTVPCPSAMDVISSALRLIGVLDPNEEPDSATAITSLSVMQDMIDSWISESLMVFTIQRIVNDVNNNPFNLVPGQQVYQLGLGAPDFNSPRPAKIERAGIINLNNPSQPLELPLEMLTDAGWQAIPVKNITTTLPQKMWNDYAFPNMNLSFWCVPSVQVQLALYEWIPLTQPIQLTDLMCFPPAYRKAIRYNLAVDLAAEFPPAVPQTFQIVASIAAESKGMVKSINARFIDLRVDSALVGSGKGIFNWLTGESTGTRSVT